MSYDVEKLLLELRLEAGMDLFLYDKTDKSFKYLDQNRFVEASIPQTLEKYINDGKTFLRSFKMNDELVVFYLFRLDFLDRKYVLVVKDSRDGINTNMLFNTIFNKLIEVRGELEQLAKEIDFLRDELSVCEKELSEKEKEKQKAEEALLSKEALIEDLETSVSVLQKSRKKMLKLIDGFCMPFFSIDEAYDLININKSLGKFCGEEALPKLVGNKCYKIVYNQPEPCPWCKIDEVKKTGDEFKQHITIEKDGKKYVFEQTIYPIADVDGNIVEFGEYINDITEHYELFDTLKKSEKELSLINQQNLEKIDEINTLKKAYSELSEAYERQKDKLSKLSNLLKSLTQQDSVNELISLRSQNKELEIKLQKALVTVRNYLKKDDENKEKLESLAKKSIYSIDRLYNIIGKRKNIDDEELKKVFDFLGGQIQYIKNMLEQKEESNELKSSN
jgi:predicted  nucleic acid-binding Zn-ribbon protein